MIDRKYTGIITKADGTVVHDYIVFRAQDKAVPATLYFYIEECRKLGATDFHIQTLLALRDRIVTYQIEHGAKIPDTFEQDLIFDASEEKEQ